MDQSKDKYWVVGGLYTDTDFKTLWPGTKLEEYGPFATLKEAEDVWRDKSWQRVDECGCRYRILVDMEIDINVEDRIMIRAASKKMGMTENDFVIHALKKYMEEYKEKHPFTREDFMEISE